MRHHAQEPLLGLKAIDQGLVFLAQDQQLILELKLTLGSAAIKLRGLEAQSQVAYDFILLPTRHPATQLLKDAAASEDLFGSRLKLDQCWCDHQTVKLKQLGLGGGIRELQGDIKSTVLALEKLDEGSDVSARQMVPAGDQ